MNKVFKVIWSSSTQSWVVVSELQKVKGKSKSVSSGKVLLPLALGAGLLMGANDAFSAVAIGTTSGDSFSSATATISGDDSVVIGKNSEAKDGFAIGSGAKSTGGAGSIALGLRTQATGSGAFALGTDSAVGGRDSVAFGSNVSVSGNNSVGIASKANVTGNNAIAIGVDSKALANRVVAIGFNANASKTTSIALGYNATSSANYSNALGSNANVSGENATGIGTNSTVSGAEAVGIGKAITASGFGDVAIGTGATIDNQDVSQFVRGGNTTKQAKPDSDISSVAIGYLATSASRMGDVIIGAHSTNAFGDTAERRERTQSTIVGSRSYVVGDQTTALGSDTSAIGHSAVALGGDDITKAAGSLQTLATDLGKTDIAETFRKLATNEDQITRNADGSVATFTNPVGGAIRNRIVAGRMGEFGLDTVRDEITGTDAASIRIRNMLNSNTAFDVDNATTAADTQNTRSAYVRTTAVGDVSLAVGSASQSLGTGAMAVGVNALTFADGASAFGVLARARGKNSIAQGTFTEAETESSVAIGAGSLAGKILTTGGKEVGGKSATALGNSTIAFSEDSIAIGTSAKAGLNKDGSGNVSAVNAIAIGKDSSASAVNAIAIGVGNLVSGDNSGAIGDPSIVAGTNSYSLGNNNIIASNTDNAISIGGQNNIGGVAGNRNGNGVVDATAGIIDMASASRAMVVGYRNKVYNADDSMVMGNNNTVTAPNVMVLGNNIETEDENAVILGNNSSGQETATVEITGTVNGLTYGDFAGKPATDTHYVSVGAKDNERQIKNVAAGNISASSTDAINGSQLYAVTSTLKTYFHTNDGTNANTGDSTTNLGKVGDAAGATEKYAVTAGVNAKATAESANAIGLNAAASGTNATAIGGNATAIGTNSVALGVRANATGLASYAMGEGALASNEKSIAVGSASKSTGEKSIAIGDGANATNTHSFAIGGQSLSTGTNAMGIGANTKATGNFSVALGNGANATHHHAFSAGVGSTALANYATAVGSGASAKNANSLAAGYKASAGANNAVALGVNSNSTGGSAVAIGNEAISSADNAIASGYRANATAANSVAVGREANAKSDYAVALGSNAAVAENLKGAVAIGYLSEASLGTPTTQATVNGVTYGDFAGTNLKNDASSATDNNSMVFSVGKAGKERQVQNVAAGQISETSTDAINGSQLYSAITNGHWKLQSNGAAVGDVHWGDTVNYTSDDKSVTITPTAEVNGVSKLDFKVNVDNDTIKVGEDGKLTVNTDAIDTNDITKLVAGDNIEIDPPEVKGNVTTYTIKTAKDLTVDSVTVNNGPTINGDGINMNGDKITNVGAGTDDGDAVNVKQLKDSQTKVVKGTNIVDVTADTDETTGATTYTVNAKGTTASSANEDYVTVNAGNPDSNNVTDYKVDLSDKAKESLAKADSAVQSFKVAVNGTDIQTVADGDTVKFVDGTGTTARDASGQITFDINKSTLTTDDAGNVTNNKAGDTFVTGDDVAKAINEATARTEKTTTVVKGSNTHVQGKVEGNNTEYTVSADKATVSVSSALTKTETPTTDATTGAITTDYALDLSKTTKDDIQKGVDAKDIVDTKGLTFTGDNGTTTTEKLLGSEVAVNGDNNITTEATDDAINIKLNKDIKVDSVQLGDNGPTISNEGGNIKLGDENNAPVQITNVASGVRNDDGTAPEGKELAEAIKNAEGDTLNNAVNVGDLKAATDAATTKVEGDQGVTVTPSTNDDGSTTYTVAAKTDGTTIKVDGEGNLTANTSDLGNNEDGTVKTPTAPDALVTAQTVTDAINNSGWNLVAEGTDGKELVNPGDTVTFKAGSENLTVKREGADITYDLAKDINVDSIQLGDNGPTISNEGSNIKLGDENNAPVSITNVKSNLAPVTPADEKQPDANAPASLADKLNNAATVGDVLNAGWNLQGNGEAVDTVTHNDTVDFVNGKGTVVTVEKKDGKNIIKVDSPIEFVNTDTNDTSTPSDTAKLTGDKPVQLTNVASGVRNEDGTAPEGKALADAIKNAEGDTLNNAVNVGDLKAATDAATTKVEGDQGVTVTPSTNDDGSTTYTVAAKTDGTTIKVDGEGNLTANTSDLGNNEDGTVKTPTAPDALVTAQTVTDAINNSGWNLVAEGTDGKELVNPGDTVTFKAGSENLTVKREGADITYDLAKDINVDSVQLGDNGPTISNEGSNIKLGDENNAPVSITNVKSNLAPVTPADEKQPDANAPASLADKLNNAATVGDVLNAGWNLQGNGEAVDTVTHNDTVDFVNGKGTVVTVEKKDGKNIIKVDSPIEFVNTDTNDTSTPSDTAKLTGDKPVQLTNVASGVRNDDGTAPEGKALADAIKNAEGDTLNNAVNVGDLQAAVNAATTKVEGDQGVTVTPSTNDDGSTTYTVAAKTDGTTIKVDGEGNLTANTSDLGNNEDGTVKTPTAPDALVTAQTVTDAINNSGWNLVAEGTDGKELVNPGDTVTFKAGSENLTVKREGADITYDLAKDINVDSIQLGDNGPTISNEGSNIKLGDENNAPVSITNVKSNLAPVTPADEKQPDANAPASLADKLNNAATVGDVLNAGWNLQGNGEAVDTVTHNDTVDFVNGKGTVVTVEKKDGKNIIKVDSPIEFVNTDTNDTSTPSDTAKLTGDKPVQLTNVASGVRNEDGTAPEGKALADAIKNAEGDTLNNAVNVGDLKAATDAATTKVEGDQGVTVTPSTNDDGSTTYTVAAKTDGTTIKVDGEGNLTANTSDLGNNEDGTVKTPTAPDALVTAQTVTDAINNSGWNLVAEGTDGKELVNPGDTVTFKAGSENLTVKREGADITYDLAKDINVDSIQLGDNGPTISNEGGNIKLGDENNAPVSITNVKSNLAPVTPADEKQPDANAPASLADKLNNAATVADVLNAGWNLQNNDTAVDTVTHNDTVNFVNGRGTTVSVTANDDGTVNNIQVDSALGYVNEDPNDTSTPSNTVKVFGKDDAPVQITNVASGVRNDDGTAPEGKELAEAIKNAEGDTLNNAVNVGDLQAAVNAATTKVEGDQGVTVTPSTNDDGSTTYTVAAKTDGTTIKVDGEGNLTANTSDLGNNEDGTVKTPTAPNALVTAQTVADAINQAGFTLKTSASEGQKVSGRDELINAGDVIDMVAGKNLTVKQEANGKVTYATKDDVTFNTVNSTTVVVGNPNDPMKSTTLTSGDKGLDVGGDKITNVANGDISPVSKDVVNGSQLNNYTKVNGNNIGTDTSGAINIVNGAGTTVTSGNAGEVKVNVNNTDLTVADNGTINVQDPNGTGAHYVNATTIAQAVNNVSWNVDSETDSATANAATKNTYTAGNNKVKAGETVKVNAGRNVEISGSGRNINVAVSDNPEFNSVKTGDTVVNNEGITINNGAAGNSVSLTKNGLDNGGNRITNVKAGVADTDAVNVGQLKGAVNNLDNKINRSNRNLRAGIAGANAAAGLPQVYIPGKSMVAAAAGTFKGESALAVGYSRASDNGKLILKLQGNANTRGDVGGSVGIGYQW